MQRIAAQILIPLTFAGALPATADSFTFETVTAPGIAGPVLTGINNLGQISGYGGAGEVQSGFVLNSNGTVTTVFESGSTDTKTLGINDSGQVVGTFTGMGGSRAYFGTPSVLTPISVPGATSTPQANGINISGDIVGIFNAGGSTHGFLDKSGTFTTIDFPGSSASQALGINAAGQIVGTFTTGGVQGAFLDNAGVFTPLNIPGTLSTTSVLGINDHGDIAGWYNSATGATGFLDIGGVLTTIVYPGASQTYVYGLNNADQLVGTYADSQGTFHAFLATPTASVPEPQSACLILLGVAAILIRRRSIRSSRAAGD